MPSFNNRLKLVIFTLGSNFAFVFFIAGNAKLNHNLVEASVLAEVSVEVLDDLEGAGSEVSEDLGVDVSVVDVLEVDVSVASEDSVVDDSESKNCYRKIRFQKPNQIMSFCILFII